MGLLDILNGMQKRTGRRAPAASALPAAAACRPG